MTAPRQVVWRTPARAAEVELRRLAIHEAGHAVAAELLGFEVTDVRIRPRARTSYRTADPTPNHLRAPLAVAMVGATLAGLAAEHEFGYRTGEAACDRDQVAGWIETVAGVYGLTRAEALAWLEGSVRELCRRHRDRIRLEADRLMEPA